MAEQKQEQDWQDIADLVAPSSVESSCPPAFGSIAVDAIRVFQQMLEDAEST